MKFIHILDIQRNNLKMKIFLISMRDTITIMLFYEFKYEKELNECLSLFPFEFKIDKSKVPCKERRQTPDELFETNVKVLFPVKQYDKKPLIISALDKYFTMDDLFQFAKRKNTVTSTKGSILEEHNPKKVKFNLPEGHIEEKPKRLQKKRVMEDRLIFHYLTDERKNNRKISKEIAKYLTKSYGLKFHSI